MKDSRFPVFIPFIHHPLFPVPCSLFPVPSSFFSLWWSVQGQAKAVGPLKIYFNVTNHDLQWESSRPESMAFDSADVVNQFTVDLYKKLSAENDGNLFLSPYSISTALAMTYGGAQNETAEQMGNTLHFGGQDVTHPAFSHLRTKLNDIQKKGHIQLSVANSLWPQVDYKFLPDY